MSRRGTPLPFHPHGAEPTTGRSVTQAVAVAYTRAALGDTGLGRCVYLRRARRRDPWPLGIPALCSVTQLRSVTQALAAAYACVALSDACPVLVRILALGAR